MPPDPADRRSNSSTPKFAGVAAEGASTCRAAISSAIGQASGRRWAHCDPPSPASAPAGARSVFSRLSPANAWGEGDLVDEVQIHVDAANTPVRQASRTTVRIPDPIETAFGSRPRRLSRSVGLVGAAFGFARFPFFGSTASSARQASTDLFRSGLFCAFLRSLI